RTSAVYLINIIAFFSLCVHLKSLLISIIIYENMICHLIKNLQIPYVKNLMYNFIPLRTSVVYLINIIAFFSLCVHLKCLLISIIIYENMICHLIKKSADSV